MSSNLENEASKPFDLDVLPVPTYYVNQFAIAFWPEEAILSFGRKRMSDSGKGDEIFKVFSTHATLKRLAQSLLESIQEYEVNFGEIHTEIVDRLTPEAKTRFGLSHDDFI